MVSAHIGPQPLAFVIRNIIDQITKQSSKHQKNIIYQIIFFSELIIDYFIIINTLGFVNVFTEFADFSDKNNIIQKNRI